MAGLPCDVCQEDTIVIPQGVIGEDADGALVYRRYRVCVNPRCERYRHRRESLEMYLPQEGPPTLVDTRQFQQRAPAAANSSLPSLFDDF